jgi:hypothetical protein
VLQRVADRAGDHPSAARDGIGDHLRKFSFPPQPRRFITMLSLPGCCFNSDSVNRLSQAKFSRMWSLPSRSASTDGVLDADGEGYHGADVAKDETVRRVVDLAEVLVRDGQAPGVFAGLRKGRRECLGRNVLELVLRPIGITLISSENRSLLSGNAYLSAGTLPTLPPSFALASERRERLALPLPVEVGTFVCRRQAWLRETSPFNPLADRRCLK